MNQRRKNLPHWPVTRVLVLRNRPKPTPWLRPKTPAALRAAAGKPAIVAPPQVPDRYLLALLYLADAMAHIRGRFAVEEQRILTALAEVSELPNFRSHPWFRGLSEETACTALDTHAAKRAALVAMSLVLKADKPRRPMKLQYFTHIRLKLAAEPIRVPIDFEDHKSMARIVIREIIHSVWDKLANRR